MRTPKPKKAFALATVLVLLGVALFGVGALVTVSSLEAKISRSQMEGIGAYYAADAGAADALWRLNNNSTYNTALLNGTLNVTYTATNVPKSGQGFTVTMVTGANGAGYADVTVDATSNNGTFIAKRQIQTSIFAGQTSANTIGTNGVMTGGSFTANAVSSISINNGGLYAGQTINLKQTNASASGKFQAVGTYTQSQTNNSAAISASNYPPAPAAVVVPGVSFANYASTATVTYTPQQFLNLIKGNNNTYNFPGPITYVNGDLNMNASVKNCSINISGLLVVNGDFTIASSAGSPNINVSDPGSGNSGILSAKNVNIAAGNTNIAGVLFVAGTTTLTNLSSFNVQGAIVSGGTIALSTISGFSVSFVNSRTNAIFGVGGAAQALQVKHWEEEY